MRSTQIGGFLLVGLSLFYLNLFSALFPFILLFGDNSLGFLIGTIARTAFIVILYFVWVNKSGLTNELSLENLNLAKTNTSSIRIRDIFVLSLLNYVIVTYFGTSLDFLNLIHGSTPNQVSYDFYVDYILSVIVAPILEEIVFRWMFFKITDYIDFYVRPISFSTKLGLNISMFALIHYGRTGLSIFDYSIYLFYIPSWMFYGFLAFLLYYRTRDLKLVILLHMFINFQIMNTRLFDRIMKQNNRSLRFHTEWYLVITIILMVILYRNNFKIILQEIKDMLSQINLTILLPIIIISNVGFWLICYVIFYYLYDHSIILLVLYFFAFFPLYCKVYLQTLKQLNSDGNTLSKQY